MTQLQKILHFAQTTGDKVIVTDPEGKEPMVVMPFHMYEHLLDIGREAHKMPQQQATEPQAPTVPEPVFAPEPEVPDDLALEFAQSHEEPAVQPEMAPPVTEQVALNQDPSLELADSSAEEGGEGEEQFYLEPVA